MSEPSTEPSPATSEPLPVIGYATPAPSNTPAVLSLVTGVLIFVPFLGIATIALARRGITLAQAGAGRYRLARIGFILGVLNLVFTLIGVVSLPPAIISARRQALRVQCMTNLRQLGMVEMMYATSNRGFTPANFDDLVSATGTYARPGAIATLLSCPACANDPTKKPATVGTKVNSNYIFLRPVQKIGSRAVPPHRAIIAYEPLTNHDGRGSAFLFLDGHCAWFEAAQATKVISELTAGQNPPPSYP